MSPQLILENVSVKYGSFEAVRAVSAQLQPGEIGCLLGPSGCGKTTLLRAIAGFAPLSTGKISINDKVVSSTEESIPPEQRNVGMVFQDFALFPHLNVSANIGFGLSYKTKPQRLERIQQMLKLVGLEHYAKAYPHELSGGQQQRVALARAMAPNPDLLLLDEPFSGLDSELRDQLASEVRDLLKKNNITAILVTHDQHEAFAMADHITLLREGSVAQSDSAYNLYHNPGNRFVAGFIGAGTIINIPESSRHQLGNAQEIAQAASNVTMDENPLGLLIRPDDIEHNPDSKLALKVTGRSFRGAQYLYELELPGGQTVPCLTPSHIDYDIGQTMPVDFNLQHLVLFDPEPS